MKAALIGSYLEFVTFKGFNERYPTWFAEELYRCAYLDESQFTLWVSPPERKADYHEKKLVEEYSIFLRKSDGELFVTDIDSFNELYTIFHYNDFMNCGTVAFNDDCIEYVECRGGTLSNGYPDWFYEYFTEVLNYPHVETVFLRHEEENIGVTATGHCVFLRNKYGEIKGMGYSDFLKYYDPYPHVSTKTK